MLENVFQKKCFPLKTFSDIRAIGTQGKYFLPKIFFDESRVDPNQVSGRSRVSPVQVPCRSNQIPSGFGWVLVKS
jgi:hypothetical protein